MDKRPAYACSPHCPDFPRAGRTRRCRHGAACADRQLRILLLLLPYDEQANAQAVVAAAKACAKAKHKLLLIDLGGIGASIAARSRATDGSAPASEIHRRQI